jgi:hypothetical protein
LKHAHRQHPNCPMRQVADPSLKKPKISNGKSPLSQKCWNGLFIAART